MTVHEKKIYSGFTTSTFIQLVRIPSRIQNKGNSKESAQFNSTGPKIIF